MRRRQLACDRREKPGLQRGRVLTRGRGDDERAEVAWEWDDPDTAACDQDMATQNTSDECMAVRRHMRTPIDRMDRVLFELVDPS